MSFRVGQKVVCVNATVSNSFEFWGYDVPEVGRVYTVTGIIPGAYGKYLAVLLAEIRNGSKHYPDIGYRLDRFRPLVEHKTDISVFTEMLTPKRQKTKA